MEENRTELESGESRPPSCGPLKRVAISIFRYFPHGGLQREMIQLAKELCRRNVEVTVFCISWDSAEPPPRGVHFHKIPNRGFGNHGRARHFVRSVARILRETPFDLHITFNKLPGADWYFCGDLPYLSHDASRSFWERLMPRYRTFAALEKELFSPLSPAKIFYLNEAQKEAYQQLYGTQEERFFPLPPGIGEEFRNAVPQREKRGAAVRAEWDIPPEKKVLILISSTFQTKGVDRAIAALAALPEEKQEKLLLLIVGRSDPAPYRALARRLGIREKVRFLGACDDIPALLSAADLMIHPARKEATGTVLLEALACGTPVLCSGNCGFAPLVEESGGVVLEQPFRQKILNRSLLLLVNTPEHWEDLQRAACDYGIQADFFHRSEVMADFMEGVRRDEAACSSAAL